MTPPEPTYIYHITDLENLRLIFGAGELRAKGRLDLDGQSYTNIAHMTIQDRRTHTSVPCRPHGLLHDYVPFYFASRSPMLFTLSKGNVTGFTGNQQSIVHLVSTVQTVQSATLDFVFTDGHGIMALTEFYNETVHLEEIDWSIMRAQYWMDTNEDPDRKRRRQAEFLVHERFPVSLVQGIGVMNEAAKTEVEVMAREFGLEIPVAVRRRWYY